MTTTTPAPRTPVIRRPAVLVSLVGAVLSFTLAASAALRERAEGPREAPPSRIEPLTVRVEPLRVSDHFLRSRTFLGQVEPARSAAVGFELAGLLARIEVDEGDRVEAGQPLATLDTDRLTARRRELGACVPQEPGLLAPVAGAR